MKLTRREFLEAGVLGSLALLCGFSLDPSQLRKVWIQRKRSRWISFFTGKKEPRWERSRLKDLREGDLFVLTESSGELVIHSVPLNKPLVPLPVVYQAKGDPVLHEGGVWGISADFYDYYYEASLPA